VGTERGSVTVGWICNGRRRSHAALMDDLIGTWRARGIDVERLKHVESPIDRRVAEGHGADGFSSLIEAIKEQRTNLLQTESQ
jgi:hypothetical protein